jgi:hypothetical protein
MASHVLLAWANTLAYELTELKTAVICFVVVSRSQCFEYLYGRSLRMFQISLSVCLWQAFLAKSNVC